MRVILHGCLPWKSSSVFVSLQPFSLRNKRSWNKLQKCKHTAVWTASQMLINKLQIPMLFINQRVNKISSVVL